MGRLTGSGGGRRALHLLVLLLFVLLAVLATLQVRWIAESSRAQEARLERSLERSSRHLAEDFDREVARLFAFFSTGPSSFPDTDELHAERYERWMSATPVPRILAGISIARRREDGGLALWRVDSATSRLTETAWPESMAALRRDLETERAVRPFDRGPGRRPPLPIAEELGILVAPLREAPLFERRRGPRSRPVVRGYVLLHLDLDFIRDEFLPRLVQRHFTEGEELQYDVVVYAPGEPPRTIYTSDPEIGPRELFPGDEKVALFSLSQLPEFVLPWTDPERRRDAPPPDRPPPRPRTELARRHGAADGVWRMVVRHRAGSLERAVANQRRFDLLSSGAVLVLLMGTLLVLILSTQRAQRLAQQQVDFVAGITHELQTPLAAICSAGQNLADGVISRREQIERYGRMIEGEGRRLSNMVSQALEFAGIETGRIEYKREPLRMEEVIDGAVADCRWQLEEGSITLERREEEDLPVVAGDRAALQRALLNLVTNAIKYGGDGGWIGLVARRADAEGGGGVAVSVEDRGPGIARADLPHIFEPFYRGRRGRRGRGGRAATGGPVQGSGLGLSLVKHIVEAHGGRVGVEEPNEGGTRFSIYLPAHPAGPASPPNRQRGGER